MVDEVVEKAEKALKRRIEEEFVAAGVPAVPNIMEGIHRIMEEMKADLNQMLYEDYRNVKEVRNIVESVRLGMLA